MRWGGKFIANSFTEIALIRHRHRKTCSNSPRISPPDARSVARSIKFRNVSNIDHLLRNSEAHAGPITTSRMMLARISPGSMGFEHRRFECPKCDSVQNEVVSSDPMKSAYVGWFAGELRAPN
jgi:hypothetical protein